MQAAEPAQTCRTRLRPGTKKPELAGRGRMGYLGPENIRAGTATGWTVRIPRARGAMVPAASAVPAASVVPAASAVRAGPAFSGAMIMTVRATVRARPSR